MTNFSLSIKLERDDSIPAFGAFLACEPEDGRHVILLNVSACLSPELDSDDGPVCMPVEDRKRLVIATLMHEFGHALEAHFNLPHNEEAIEKACADWELAYIQAQDAKACADTDHSCSSPN